MALPTSTSSVSYAGNGSTSTLYPVPFVFFLSTDLSVYAVSSGVSTKLINGTDYTVTGGGFGNTGNISTAVAYPSTTTIIISRNVPYVQATSLTTGDEFPAVSMEQALDNVVMQTQQLSRNIIPDTATATGAAPYVFGVQTIGGTPGWVSAGSSTILDGSITSAKLATAAVTTTKIADGSITAAKLDSSVNTGGATGGGTDKVFYENDQTVNTAYTITTNKNAVTGGPITVAAGISVTVPSGSTWTIV